MPRRGRRTRRDAHPARGALLVAAALGFAGCALAGSLPLSVEVRARAVAPGEPLRIEIVSPEPLASLGGRFLDQDLFPVRERSEGEGERWAAWAMIDLDHGGGVAVIEVLGTAASGRTALGSRALTIEAREFPSEELSVAPKYVEPPAETRERLARERAELQSIYRERRREPFARDAFVRPVPGGPTSVFGTRRLYNGKPRSPHPGLDLRAPTGSPVRASGPGVVVVARDLYYSGNTVILDHGGGLFTIYAHLSEIMVAEGDRSAAGQVLGHSGATGRVTGPHLHWGAKIGDRPFDPMALLDPRLFPAGTSTEGAQ